MWICWSDISLARERWYHHLQQSWFWFFLNTRQKGSLITTPSKGAICSSGLATRLPITSEFYSLIRKCQHPGVCNCLCNLESKSLAARYPFMQYLMACAAWSFPILPCTNPPSKLIWLWDHRILSLQQSTAVCPLRDPRQSCRDTRPVINKTPLAPYGTISQYPCWIYVVTYSCAEPHSTATPGWTECFRMPPSSAERWASLVSTRRPLNQWAIIWNHCHIVVSASLSCNLTTKLKPRGFLTDGAIRPLNMMALPDIPDTFLPISRYFWILYHFRNFK
jgi:hypothetical protein